MGVKVAMSVTPGLGPREAEIATAPSFGTATALAKGSPGSVPYEPAGASVAVLKASGLGYPLQRTRKVPPPGVMAPPSSSVGQSLKWMGLLCASKTGEMPATKKVASGAGDCPRTSAPRDPPALGAAAQSGG